MQDILVFILGSTAFDFQYTVLFVGYHANSFEAGKNIAITQLLQRLLRLLSPNVALILNLTIFHDLHKADNHFD